MALNKEWHRLNRMPPGATREQRIKWHVAHARVCGCRQIPESVRADVEKLLKSRKR
ncbi:MAG TPA: hypothetical protein VK734_19810 [Bradyrhizobium sp.]|nr:hypothetical protein [Bradyrhizobium sp.]